MQPSPFTLVLTAPASPQTFLGSHPSPDPSSFLVSRNQLLAVPDSLPDGATGLPGLHVCGLHLTEPDLEPKCGFGFSLKISHPRERKQEENRIFETLIQGCLLLQWAALCALYGLSCSEQLWLSSTSAVLKLRLIVFPSILLAAVSLKCGKQLVQSFGLELAGLTLNKVSKYIEQQLEFGNNQITLSAKLCFTFQLAPLEGQQHN
ncbi:hypothetical protein llap_10976 [Limosa lapponica baueri]|uniref:Uncharacterized protein n=1 Tax=Limosa lapponica baueri TaxID=1758121 RepID=A0A2I0TY72_LIMLA|nr:hypothetical protein llap_10976 [Limosa lapponica baueri]